jgi:hypothetical protein
VERGETGLEPFVWDHFTELPRNAGDQHLLEELRAMR